MESSAKRLPGDAGPPSIEHRTLFEGRDVAVDVHDGGHPVSIVTFEPRNKHISATAAGAFGSGFGRGRFAALGFNEYLVKRSRNHWYQTPEMDAVVDLIASETRGTRVITYGTSMGAFAAINFADSLGADEFIALSPLHDVAPANEAGDERWPESGVLDFTHNFIRGGRNRRAHGYVFYVRGGEDQAHSELIQRDTRAELSPVEFGGHPCSFFVNAAYGLKRLVMEVAAGTFDVSDFERGIAIGAEQTFYPYERRAAELARSGQHRDLPAAIDQLRIAVAKKPGLPRLRDRLGDLLRRSGDLPGAEEAYRSSLALRPHNPAAHIGLGYVFAARNDFESAIHAVDRAIAINPKHEYYTRRADWSIEHGDLLEAERSLVKVIELVPDASVAPRRLAAVREQLAAQMPTDDSSAPVSHPPGGWVRRVLRRARD